MTKRTIKLLLLVEDNPGDARLIREMFNEQGANDTRIDARGEHERGGEVPCRTSR